MSSEFPNRWRKELERSVPEQHPASDVLNAYVEKALTAAEERQVNEHLAVCAECRDVIFLASEAAEEPAQPVLTPERAPRGVRWWTWAAPIAAVLVVATVVFVGRPNPMRTRTETMARVAPPPVVEQKQQPATPAEAAPANKTEFAAKLQQEPTVKGRQTEPLKEMRNAPAVASPPASVPAREKDKAIGQSSQTVEVTAENAVVEPQAGLMAGLKKEETVSKPAAAPAPIVAGARDAMSRDYAADQASSLGAVSGSAAKKAARADAKVSSNESYSFSAETVAKRAAMSSWRVTAEGALQHFNLGQWQPVLANSGSHFLTVTTFGNQVWAGGKNLALYHSSDGGATWEQQSLRIRIAADIVQIAFTSATEGVLTTNLGSGFATHDGGKTWAALERSKP